ncbi:MAG: hypothetical protein ACTSVU_04005 [Promethearchaeota archaeon]
MNISEPSHPQIIKKNTHWDRPAYQQIEFSTNRMICKMNNGFEIYSIKNPLNPVLISR